MTASTACAVGCGQPSPDAAICRTCTTELRNTLQLAASIAPDLDDAVARQLRHGTGKRTGTEAPLPYDQRASDAATDLRMALAAALGRINYPHQRQWPPGLAHGIAPVATHLEPRVAEIAQHPLAADMHHDIRRAVARAVAILEPPPERIYAGPCPQCGSDLLGTPGMAMITCLNCGAAHDVSVQQAAMKEEVREMLGTAQWCATASAALGVPVSDSAVRMWALRRQLIPRGHRPSVKGAGQVALYRLGDVLDLIASNPRKQHA